MIGKRFLMWTGLWLAAVSLYAQTPIYPVRKNHKSGFIVLLGKNKTGSYKEVAPYYELISDAYLPWNYLNNRSWISPFLLFENDGKVGLLNQQLQEVLPNKYQRIRPLTSTCFAVETDSLFHVIDLSGKTLIKGRFSDICTVKSARSGEPDYFFVQRNRRWGIYSRLADSLLFEPRFTDLEPAYSPDFFRVKTTEEQRLWGLTDRTGKLVLPVLYRNIIAFNRAFMAVEIPGNGWRLIIKNDALPELYQAVLPLTQRWALVSPKRNAADMLWNVETQTPVSGLPDSAVYRRFWPFDAQHIIGKLANGWEGLLDSNLRMVVKPMYDSIAASGAPNRYYVQSRGRWGLLVVTDSARLVHPCDYRAIAPFEAGVAWVETESGTGAINRVGVEIALPLYQTLERPSPDHLKGRTIKGDLVTIELGEQDGNVVAKTANALIDPINIPNNVRRWILNEPDSKGISSERPDYESRDTTRWGRVILWRSFTLDQLPAALLQKLGVAATYTATKAFQFSGQLFGISKPEQTVQLAYIEPYYTQTVQVFTLYHADGSTVAQAPPLIGYRPFQDGYRYTTFIDATGKMGLIDRAGQELRDNRGQPVRYAYIGPFRVNRARVCLTGQLVAGEIAADNEPRRLADPEQFARQFQLSIPTQQMTTRIRPNQLFYTALPGTKRELPQWGFIDAAGQLVPGPRYDFVHSFHENDSLALVARVQYKDSLNQPDILYGALDTALHTVIEAKYLRITRLADAYRVEIKSAAQSFNLYYFNPRGHQLCTLKKVPRGFSEGLCGLRGPDDRWGFMDTAGVMRIDFQYHAIQRFSEGLAAVSDGQRWSFIDTAGHVVFTPALSKSSPLGTFRGGRCSFARQEKWGYYDKTGREIIPAKYSWASNFSYGAAAVKIKDVHGKTVAAVIDSSGHFLLPPTGDFIDIKPFDAFGKALLRRKDNTWVVVNNAGKVISAPYAEIKTFIDGFANVRRGNAWGSISLEGQPRVPVMYAAIDATLEGLVAVQPSTSGKWIFVDTLGRPSTVRGAFDQPGRFKDGAAMIGNTQLINRHGEKLLEKERVLFFSEGLYGLSKRKGVALFTDATGSDFFKLNYDSITPFKHGIAKVRLLDKKIWGMINRHGLYVLYPKYGHIGEQPDGNFVVNPQRYYGLIDRRGRMILEPQYDRISAVLCAGCTWHFPAGGAVYRVESGEAIGYFAPELPVEKQWIWPMQQ